MLGIPAATNIRTSINAEISDIPLETRGSNDFWDNPGLTEMMTTYVILSRVRRASSILILRAFSLRLFQQGCPPGPFCLLKYLRARFNRHQNDDQYTSAQAIDEYKELIQRWESKKEQKTHRKVGSGGSTTNRWKCFCCEKTYTAEGFNASSNSRKDINELCVQPGYWRACIACTAAIFLGETDSDKTVRTCITCTQSRTFYGRFIQHRAPLL